MNTNKIHKAFSLIEIAVVILIIGILIIGISSSLGLYQEYRLSSARNLTKNSIVGRINGLKLWLEATSEQSFAKAPKNGEAISEWRDLNFQNTNKINLIQPDTLYQPKYTDSGINNLPALDFNQSISSMYSQPISYYDIGGIDSVSVFTVIRSLGTNSANPSSLIFYQITHNGSEIFRFSLYNFHINNIKFQFGTSNPGICSGFSTNNCRTTVSSDFINHPNQNYIISVVKSPTMAQIFVNSILNMTNNAHIDKFPSSYNNISNVSLGGSRKIFSLVGEIIIYDRALTEKEIADVHNYLQNKWQIR